MPSIVWDFRTGKPAPVLAPLRSNGGAVAKTVWCAAVSRDVEGIACECYMKCNYYYTGKCTAGLDGRTFRDPHD